MQKKNFQNQKAIINLLLKSCSEDYAADAVRYWTASGSLGQDVAFSENQLKIGGRLMTKLWNAFWFTREHTAQVTDLSKVPKELGILNEWILHQATVAFTDYTNYLDKHEMSIALQHAEQFFWSDFCDNYLELVKDQLFNPDKYPIEQIEATRWTLAVVGLRILQLFAPYMPFITESIYDTVYQKTVKVPSLHQTRYSLVQTPFTYDASALVMRDVLHVISAIRKLKSEQQLSLKTELHQLSISCNDAARLKALEAHIQLMKGVTQAHTIVFTEQEQITALMPQDDKAVATVAL